MAFTRTWDANYEGIPANANSVGAGALRIRNFKTDIRERMAQDHYFDVAGTDAEHGEHSKVTLRLSANAPANAANKGFLYTANISNLVELFYLDDSNHITQITSNGNLVSSFPANTKMLFYQDTAPTGWTVDETLNDKLVFITKGSNAGGQTGGNTHSNGTWTQPNHLHTVSNHSHRWLDVAVGNDQVYHNDAILYDIANDAIRSSYYSFLIGIPTNEASTTLSANHDLYTQSTGGGNTSNSATANTWRPSAYCCIVCTKD